MSLQKKIEVFTLGAGQDVGRSCVIIRMENATVMFDCGIHMGYHDNRRFPDFEQLKEIFPPINNWKSPTIMSLNNNSNNNNSNQPNVNDFAKSQQNLKNVNEKQMQMQMQNNNNDKMMFDNNNNMENKNEKKIKYGWINDIIDLVIITHFHLDHCGALPLLTETYGYNGPILMTHPTQAISPLLLKDYSKIGIIKQK